MKIYETNRTQADAVLAILNTLIDDCECIEAEFKKDFYSNGRENGYVLEFNYIDGHYLLDEKRLWIAFSKSERNNSIVVYTDKGRWYECLTEKAYRHAKYFKSNQLCACAKYIKSLMKNAAKQAHEEIKNKEA